MAVSGCHARHQNRCGACGFLFQVGDRIIALVSKDSTPVTSSVPYTIHDADTFQESSLYTQSRAGATSYPTRCPRCTNRESAMMHIDCFRLFIQECTAKDKEIRLWQAATWRIHWTSSSSTFLMDNDVSSTSTMRRAAELCHLPELRLLPAEVIEKIWRFSQPNAISRFASVLDLAHAFSIAEHQGSPLSLPVGSVDAWSRGGDPVIRTSDLDKPIIRLTFDLLGLQRIEKLDERPERGNHRSDAALYIVADAKYYSEVSVDVHHGLGHLSKLFAPQSPAKMWDTPCPPMLDECELFPRPRQWIPRPRFSTIQLDRCTGITFFIHHANWHAIHGHTPAQPHAQATFERLCSWQQRHTTWVYVPLRQGITAFGVRAGKPLKIDTSFILNPCFLLRTPSDGDLVVGHYPENESEDLILGSGPKLTLIHDLGYARHLSALYTHPKNKEDIVMSPHVPVFENPFSDKACFASAPLENVASIQAFYEEENGYCLGFILRYENGSERAVGQCRTGKDLVRTIVNPACLCFFHEDHHKPVTSRTVRLEVSTSPEHQHDKPGWTCSPMCGTVETWYNHFSMQLYIVGIDQ
ncbi:hypothetical protein PT974_05970 [Cladobotryum mycophilum]|uniref:Uncharacterized protein n=1 Tax=Cladobotryum mycophilum TaxID=491253 RepID=A0ABR0SK67_9HYPO